MRLGTITSLSPLRVRLDGDPTESTPTLRDPSLTLAVDARVLCVLIAADLAIISTLTAA